MPATFQAPLLFGLVAAAVTSLGLLTVAFHGQRVARQSGLFSLAAAGMLLSLTLLHILPEALGQSERAPLFLLAGFFAGLGITTITRHFFPERAGGQGAALTPLLAVGLHSFLDGVIYSVTFAASFEAGVYAASGLILHEFAEGVICFAILLRHGFSIRGSAIWAFLAAGATTPLGVFVSGFFIGGLGPETVALLYAVSAGLLVYVATGPLMQSITQEPPARGFGALGAGVAIAFLLMSLPVHGHVHGPHDTHGHVHAHQDPAGIHLHE